MEHSRFPALALLLLPLAPLTACHRHHDRETVIVADETTFYLDRDLVYESNTRYYDWTTVNDSARVTLRAEDFHHGSVRIRIFDDIGIEILDEVYWWHQGHWILGDVDFKVVTFTDVGEPGLWTIRLDVEAFDGRIRLELE